MKLIINGDEYWIRDDAVLPLNSSKNLNQKKFNALQIQAKLLGQLKSNIWNKFGSISGIGINDRQIRNKWLADKHSL